MFKLAIIGGGPAGYVAAQRLAAKGESVILFEKNELGGVCLNEGCIPTKTLLYSAKLYESIKNADKFGVKALDPSFDYEKILVRKEKVVKKLVGAIKASMRGLGVTVIKGTAIFDGGEKGDFKIVCEGEEYYAENVLLCTGSHTFRPKIDWLESASDKVITSKEALKLTGLPDKIAIIGGGVIGMEFASLFNALGSQVSIFEMQNEILGSFDTDIAASLRKVYEAKGVKFFLNGDERGKTEALEADLILLCIGRKPNVTGLGLETIGLKTDERGQIAADSFMRTDVDGVYAAGDVTGKYMLAHVASREAEVAVNNILGVADKMSYSAVPSVVYTKPELACVGLTEKAARAQNIDYEVRALPLTYSGRFVAETERENGLCKIIYENESQKVLGVQILGGPASEIISTCCLAIENEATLEDLRETIFPHPSVSEIIKEVSWVDIIQQNLQ